MAHDRPDPALFEDHFFDDDETAAPSKFEPFPDLSKLPADAIISAGFFTENEAMRGGPVPAPEWMNRTHH